jgi:hypothetical protein
MWRRAVVATATIVGVVGPAAPVGAQEPAPATTTTTAPAGTTTTARLWPPAAPPAVDEAGTVSADGVAAVIAEEGWYAHPDAVGDREQLAQVAARLADGSEPMGFALLADEPPGSSTAFAEAVLDSYFLVMGGMDVETVVVLSDEDVGVVSDVWGDEAVDVALDETIDQLRADPTDGLEALAGVLSEQPKYEFGDDDGDGGGGGGGGGEPPWILIAVLFVGVVVGLNVLFPQTEGEGDDGSSYRRRRYRSFSSSRSSFGSRRSSSGGSSRRSSGGSRGRGGRRL